MPFTQVLLLKVPTMPLCLIMVAISVFISIMGLVIVRRYVGHAKLKTHNDIAGAIFGTLGMMYSVLVAFIVIIVWQDFDRSNLSVENEANYLSDIYRDCEPFPQPLCAEMRNLCKEYSRAVVDDEWKTIEIGQDSPAVRTILDKMWKTLGAYSPAAENEKVFFKESVHKLNGLGEMRRSRLMDSRAGIHPVLWFVLLAGGLSTILFTLFFGSENMAAQVTMVSLLAVLIALILFTILVFDFPFTGGVSISSEPIRDFIIHL